MSNVMSKSAAEFGVGTRHTAFDVVEVDDGNFNYDSRILVETSQKEALDLWIRPTGGVVNQKGPFTFVIEPQVDKYIQLNRAGLEVTCRVVKQDDTVLSSWDDIVAPVNLLGACMWESVEVALNQQPFKGASSINAHYKAFLETMLSYDSDSRNTHLSSQFLYMDSPGYYGDMKLAHSTMKEAFVHAVESGEEEEGPDIPEDLKPAAGFGDGDNWDQRIVSMATDAVYKEEVEKAKKRRELRIKYFDEHAEDDDNQKIVAREHSKTNYGYNNRWKIVAGSHAFDMYSPITHDFFKLDNHIAPGNRIEIRLTMAPHAFLLNTYLQDNGYKLHLEDMRLHLHLIERRERVPVPMREKYQMNETQLHKQLVAANSPNTSFRIHNGGILPKTVLVAMVYTKAAEGNYAYNPFNFHHFYAKRMFLRINGETYPSGGLEFDFAKPNPHIARAYHWLFENTGSADTDKGNIVSYPAFQHGLFIVPFDLTPDKCNGLHTHNAEYGYIDLNIEFYVPLSEPIYVLYEMVFPKVVINDKLTNTVMSLDVEA